MKEENKLIAEFLGYKIENKKYQSIEYHSSNESHWEWNEGEIVTLNGNEVCDSSQEPFYSLEDLPFDSDWNWLMEVVDKISSELHYSINATLEFLSEEQNRDGLYGIKDVYEAVVEYVKLYNEQK
jgi:hypothetical protein